MSPPTPQPNTKRYWGEERSIDSIYSIYLKKISYSYNNDTSMSVGLPEYSQNSYHDQVDDAQSTNSASTSDSFKLNKQTCDGKNGTTTSNKSNGNDSNCRIYETPRGRKNFFQKYRRRSCSVDKYSIDKQSHRSLSSASSSNKNKGMKFPTSSKRASQISKDLSVSHEDFEGLNRNGLRNSDQSHTSNSDITHKSTNELSNQSLQSLQWETRQIKVLQAATLDHALKFILLMNSTRNLNNLDPNSDPIDSSVLEEERNNVAHIIHVLFCTYRIYVNPHELMLKLMDYSDLCRIEQYRFIMHYWMENYPDDFYYVIETPDSTSLKDGAITNTTNNLGTSSINSYVNSITSCDSLATTRTEGTSDSENSANLQGGASRNGSDDLTRRLSNLSLRSDENVKQGVPLITELMRICRDQYILNKALKLNDMKAAQSQLTQQDSSRRNRQRTQNGGSSRNSAVLDLDSRYVAQQLTAIDLENFLNLKPHSLLEGTRSDKRVQLMIKNFNRLSRHVVVTILKSHTPHIVTAHWIAIAMNLRKIKNFNSLKAIIAGLTNESIHRLRQIIWSKIDRTSMSNFKLMATIVDDVNNQTVLRQTQLVTEGTAKMSIEDDSFGTIPYLGTFFTDLNMIDARYPSYVPSPKDETSKLKLINFDKCAKQFEILTQVQLLQKNVLASLHAIQRRNNFDEQSTLNKLKIEYTQKNQMLLSRPAIPQASRLFENWFYDDKVAAMTDKQCYEISVSLEQNVIPR